MSLRGSTTHQNLMHVFARESQANRRYLWFAEKADVEGYPDIAAVFRSIAEGETGHAQGLLEYLAEVGDPITGEPIGDTKDNLHAALVSETHESDELYPGFAETARQEGFVEIAEWLDTLARSEATHARRFEEGLNEM